MKHGIFLLLTSTLLLSGAAQADEKQVDFKLEQLKKNLYVLYGRGGNIAVSSGEDGIYIVDDQFANLSDDIKAQLKTLNKAAPEFVINTHHHGDHTGGNENFANAGSHIIAHHNVYERLKEKHGADSDYLPVLSFGQDMKLNFNQEQAHLWHYHHAHTDGDAVVFFKNANAVHMGDLFFNLGSLPFVDVDGGGSLNGLMKAIEDIIHKIDDKTIVIPGHGQVTNKSALIHYLALLNQAKSLMLKAMHVGASLEDVVTARPLAPLELQYASWLPEERVTTLFYRSLTEK
ncbi:MBL fold metallo-hydrolase (plasmid) [Pseudoalteromonas sp. T1lg65]|uniref:MBL fold metallo-hydrolase n=1 Tax=Pseudoalteromonas sp. T1lg65 TaxID=2077101 RepID=UPI003F7A3F2D